MDEHETPGERGKNGGPAAPDSGMASVVLATFENSHAAERMVASLGRDFRHEARKGSVSAFVVTRHRDGSFKLVQSRVVTGSGVASAGISFTASILAGFMGSMSALRGAKTLTHGAHERQSHVRQPGQRLTELLDQVGQHSAALLIVCRDEQTGQAVAACATERGSQSWHLSRAEFRAALDRLGDNYDWIRPALAEPAPKTKEKHPSPRRPPASS
jgi:uncharacterized membrane protein